MKIGDTVTFRKNGIRAKIVSMARGTWSGKIIIVIEPLDDKTRSIVCEPEDVDCIS